MRDLTKEDIANIEVALTHHINYSGKPLSTKGIIMLPYSANSSSEYLRIMDYISIRNSGSISEKLSKTLGHYFNVVGVSNLSEALNRLEQQLKEV